MKQKIFIIAVLLTALAIPQCAKAYSFSAVCSTGQTLYYNISGSSVSVTRQNSSSPYYSTYPTGNLVIPSSVTYNGTTYSVTSIGNSAFSACSGLTSVIIPNSVTSIGTGAFYQCIGLTSVTIPNSVTSIGNSVFSGCVGLTSVTIPNSVTSIGSSAFHGCSGLTSVTVEIANTVYDSRGNCNAIIETSTNTLIAGCMSTSIPNSVTAIGSYAFYGCSGLTSVTIPNSVTSIGSHAFYNCSGLTSVTIPNSVTSIGYSVFSGCDGLTSVQFNAENCADFSSTFGPFRSCTNISNFSFGGSVSRIPANCCYGLSNLTAVIIPNSVTSIGSYAFYNCLGLTSVTIGGSVTSIGSYAFCHCLGLTSVTIPNSVTSIGDYAFEYCDGLTSVTIGDSVTSIGSYAFYNCLGLTSVTIGGSVTSIGSSAFLGCSGLTSVTIPNSVTSIGEYAFSYCSGLTSVTIPNSVTSIGDYAFSGCDSISSLNYNCPDNLLGSISKTHLQTVVIGDLVASISDNMFKNCANLTSVTIGNFVTSIGTSAFQGCSGLTSVNYTGTIAQWCVIDFSGFSSNPTYYSHSLSINGSPLTNLVIPEGVTQIKQYAFYNCSGLTEITSLATTAPTLGSGAFSGVSSTIPVHILCGSMASYQTTWSYFSNISEPPAPYSIIVGVTDTTFGVSNVTEGPSCDAIAVITATANYGYHFTQWNDGVTTNPRTIQLTSDTSLIAQFDRNQYRVTGVANNSARGVVIGSDTVYYLDTVTLEAIANYGYYFYRWNDNNTTNPRQIVATGNITKTAVFNPNQYSITLSVDTSIHGSCSGGGSYNYLSNRTITATANYGYHFTQWNDGVTTNPRTIQLTQDTAFTAMFAKNSYIVTVMSNDATRGTVAGNDTVEYLDSITISATADYGYHFTRWQDNNTDNPRRVQVTQNKTYTAYFDFNQYSITLNVDTSIHGTVSGGGNYNYLSNRTISSTANYGYHFTQWNDGNTQNPRTITLTQDTAFTAHFAKNQYTVNVAASHSDRGSVTGGDTVDYLDSVTVTATANYGYHFDHWSDGSTDNPHTIAATQNVTLTAYFVPNQYAIVVESSDTTKGYVSGGGNYNYLSNRTITANANYGYHFMQWNDGNTQNPRSITLTQDTAFTAYFARNAYQLTLNNANPSLGTVTGSGTYLYLDTAHIVANAIDHHHLVNWSDGNAEATRDIVITADLQLTATFAIDTYTVNVVSNDIVRGMVQASGTEFVYGTPCTVTATAYSGYTFAVWSNGATYNPYTFAALEDTELMAIFEEEGTQGIDDVADKDNIRIFSKYDRILIDGLNGQDVSLYTIDGRAIAYLPKATEHTAIPITTAGVYIVKIGNHPALKIVVIR